MTIEMVGQLSRTDSSPRPLVFVASRLRGQRAGSYPAIAAVSKVQPVEPGLDVQRYADALSDATANAADARRSAWTDAGPGRAFPPSAPAMAALSAILGDEADGGADPRVAGAGPAVPRNVTPVTTSASSVAATTAGPPRLGMIFDGPSADAFASGTRAYRQVASLVA